MPHENPDHEHEDDSARAEELPLDSDTTNASEAGPTLDLTDEGLLATGAPEVVKEGDQVILDLRELAPTGRRIASGRPRSGRPPDLLPGHRMVTITGGDWWTKAERFVYDIYLKLGYTAESSRGQVEELDEYSDHSHFYAVADERDQIVGTIRAIFGSFDDLPVGKFTRVDYEDQEPMCELSSIVVDSRVRSRGIIEHLYREGWAEATRRGALTITGVGEKWLLDTFRDTYALPFVPVGLPDWYMGGLVIPMTMANTPSSMAETERENSAYWYWNLEALTADELEQSGFLAISPKSFNSVIRNK